MTQIAVLTVMLPWSSPVGTPEPYPHSMIPTSQPRPTYPPPFLHVDDKEVEEEGEVTTAERLTESLIKLEL